MINPIVWPLNSGKPLVSRPAEPTLVDAAATFRVTSDIASSLTADEQPTRKVGVNSIGEILRHEKLRRLEKASLVSMFISRYTY